MLGDVTTKTHGPSGDDRRIAETFASLIAEGDERHPPFRWQLRLICRLLSADLPKAVDVPTGLGKTAVMALWLIALAEGSALPRRLVYVVDRRAVVDQATRFAERLRSNMSGELKEKLRLNEGNGGLPISTLRGGFADNRDWLEDPSKPAIVVGTIDMVGSRLLFEGYGVSRRMRPYHAGLLGVDSLVVLDEAHLCPPFEALLRRVAEQRDGEFGPLSRSCSATPSFHLMSLSATGRDLADTPPQSIFRLEDDDRKEPVVHQRLTARKRLKLIELVDPKSLTEQMAERAVELGAVDHPSRVLVYCDSRRDAVDVKSRIDKDCKRRKSAGELATQHNSELLVGERRVYERKALEGWLEQHGFLGTKTPPSTPTFLVATSAGEVGVDMDADHMVCDLVAYERMVQRLGRVNRRGGQGRIATIDVFALRPELKEKGTKAGKERSEEALDVFERRLAPLSRLPAREDERREASPWATGELKSKYPDVVSAATSPAALHPPLSRPVLDAWAMTSLEQHEGRPEVAPWLRGWEEDEVPQTIVVWRKHLPCRRADGNTSAPPTMVADFFRTAPIHATEKLEAASTRVLDWLLKRASRLAQRDGDSIESGEIMAILVDRDGAHVESANLGELTQLAAPGSSMRTQERRQRDRRKKEWKERLLPGRLLVVDKRIGGCSDGMLLDGRSDLDVPTSDSDEQWMSSKEDPTSESSRPLIRFRVQQVTAGEGEEGLNLPLEVADWRHVRTLETYVDNGGMARQGLAVYKWHDDAEDEEARSILATSQLLRDHAEQVASRVRHLAECLKLPNQEVEALVTAARLHDDGKAAPRWQKAMNAPDDGVYAKTKGGGNLRLLEGYRHEFGSLVKAESEDFPEPTRDLILHLIAAHHGYARPLISCLGCDEGPPSDLEARAGDAALRFARLQKEFGPWGLAWREAILRAADQAASRAWSNSHRRRNDG